VLCRGLTGDQAEQLVAAMVPVNAPANTTIFSEGEKSSGLMIFVRGTAEVFKHTANRQRQTLATVHAPTILGEMGLLRDTPRTATVKTLTDCEFHLLTRTQFLRLLENDSLAAYKLIATVADVLAHRLDLMDRKVLELSEHHRDAAPVEELSRLREKLFTEWSF
jgi:CRP-like cAMP-binding protein